MTAAAKARRPATVDWRTLGVNRSEIPEAVRQLGERLVVIADAMDDAGEGWVRPCPICEAVATGPENLLDHLVARHSAGLYTDGAAERILDGWGVTLPARKAGR